MTNANQILEIIDKDALIIEMSSYLSKKCNYGEELNSLTQEEKVFYLCQTLEMEINSGGFNSFFWNSYGDHTMETLEALKTINALKTVELLEEAIRKFPDGIVPQDNNYRQDIIENLEREEISWDEIDSKFYEYPDNLFKLNYDYLMGNKSKFL